jgi:hypothetical protein
MTNNFQMAFVPTDNTNNDDIIEEQVETDDKTSSLFEKCPLCEFHDELLEHDIHGALEALYHKHEEL